MKAFCTNDKREVELREVPTPTHPPAEHLLVSMNGCGINPGDIAFLKRVMPRKVATSLYDVWGVSGAGKVIAIGDGVPEEFLGKKVSVYRSLMITDHTIGTWCEISQLHFSTLQRKRGRRSYMSASSM